VQPGAVELVWSAPEACPDATVVRSRAERILNRPLAMPTDAPPLTVTAVVTAASDTQPWTIRLETGRAGRTVQAASCDELANATALFVAILVEPSMLGPEPEAAPPAEPLAPTPPPAAAESAPVPSTSFNSASWSIGGTVGARSALVPDWAFGLGGHGVFSWKALRVSVGASVWHPDGKTLEESEQQGAEIQVSSAFAELCLQLHTPLLIPALCSGAELSLLRGEGFGPGVEPEARAAALVSVSAGGALLLRQSKMLSWVLDLDAVFPLGQRQFVLSGSAPALIYEPAMGFRSAFGAELSF
jgi:hypothetical protein